MTVATALRSPPVAASRPGKTQPFHLSEAWARCWAEAYGSGRPVDVRAGDTRLRMERRVERRGPLRFPLLASPTNLQTCYFDVEGEARAAELDALPERLLATGAPQVRIDWLTGDSPLLAAAAGWQGRHRTLVEFFALSPLVDCRDPFETYLARTGSTVRKVWKSCRRHVLNGPLDFAIVTGGPALQALLDEMFALEAAGWKGRAGDAILSNPQETHFYTALAFAAAEAGALRIATLREGADLLAYEYCVVSAGTVLAMKVGYDEGRSRLQPGHMAALLNIADACADPAIAWYDMLGNSTRLAAYKRRFATDYRKVYRLRLFSGSPSGRLLHAAYRLKPLARAVRNRLRGLNAPSA
ncbi:MAG: GNAT family N-acetyltransferase [Allosphingosinicella sp.]